MKKPLLNLAVSLAMSSIVFSGSVLSTQVYASEPDAIDQVPADHHNSNHNIAETYLLPGAGFGAATGAIVAGPAGLLIGGLIGAFVGSNQEITVASEIDTNTHNDVFSSDAMQEITPPGNTGAAADIAEITTNKTGNNIQLAQLGPVAPIVDDKITQQEKLMNILVSDLSLDVYFRSGSTDIEKFYPARLAAVADLVNTMDKLELHLDGYTDRRGNKAQNIALANQRIEKVREQLVNAGVDKNRIVSKAFGEARMKSSAGNLEAYTFDRRVVIRFERANETIGDTMAAVFSSTEAEKAVENTNNRQLTTSIENNSHVVADAASGL